MGEQINAIPSIRPIETSNEEAAWLETRPSSGATLHELFNGESFSATSGIGKTREFWNNASSPSSYLDIDDIQPVEPSLAVAAHQINTQPRPLSPLPVLEEPEVVPPLIHSLPSKQKNANATLTLDQLQQATSLMSGETLSNLMRILLRAQFELEKETAVTAEDTFTHYQKLKDVYINMLQEVKETLAKDERVAGFLENAQNITLFATFICQAGIAAAQLLGLVAPAAMTVTLVLTAGMTALISGTTAYFKRRTNEDRAKHTTYEHQDKLLSEVSNESRDYLTTTLENDDAFKECEIQIIKRLRRMSSLMLKRS